MMNGIDISSFQKGINIPGLTTTEFVIVKATQGLTYVNECFTEQITAAINSGKKIGVYHYATGAGVAGEAEHFLSVVKPYIGKAVLALDWETSSSSVGKNSAFANLSYAKSWLDYVKQKTGVSPVIYTSESVAAGKNWSSVAKEYKLWGAQYANYVPTDYKTNPWTSGGWGAWGSKPTIFQYSSSGRITGYNGNLDLDLFYGNAEDWDAMAGAKSYTEGWVKDGKGWWYRLSDGGWPASTWKKIDGQWYYFGTDGYMLASQWIEYNGNTYYLGSDGAMVTNRTLRIDETGKVIPAGNYYHTFGDLPVTYKTELQPLVESGRLKGKGGSGDEMILDMTEDCVRAIIIASR